MQQIFNNPEINIGEIEFISQIEKDQILTQFNDVVTRNPSFTIHEWFEQQVAKTPDHVAVVCGEEEITYNQLNKKANSLANLLRKNMVTKGRVVAIVLDRSIDFIISIFGILKSGAAYLPIDTEYPDERINHMLLQANAAGLISRSDFQINMLSCFRINIDEMIYTNEDVANLSNINSDNDLVYTIFTSGSTGRPKGVMVEHGSLVNYISWRIKAYDFSDRDVALQLLSVAFDGFGAILYSCLLSGGKLVLLNSDHSKNVNLIKQSIINYGITCSSFVPSLYRLIIDASNKEDIKTLRIVTLAAEKTDKSLVNSSSQLNPNLILVNEYGPTENTIGTTANFSMSEGNVTSIGKPISNNHIVILNEYSNLLPIGVPGELCISGAGLARGYINDDELTADKFRFNPFFREMRMYRTGDLVRWLPDGSIEYIDRIDDQVKLNGYRIELSEITCHLQKYSEVADSIVTVRNDASGKKMLCAYYVAEKEIPFNMLREFLSEWLPVYMIPSSFTKINKIPLSPNGKADKNGLPEPKRDENSRVVKLPVTLEEHIICQAYSEVFGISNLDLNNNFFELGGDSIRAIQIVSRLQKYNRSLEVKDVYSMSPLKKIAEVMRMHNRTIDQSLVEGNVELLPIQRWFFNKGFKCNHHWNQAIIVKAKSNFEKEHVIKSITEIVKHHDALRMVFDEKEGWISQYNRGIEDRLFAFSMVDMMHLDKAELIQNEIRNVTNKLHASQDLIKGPLIQIALIKTLFGDHLFITIHHLVIDGVSWRIFLNDFTSAYTHSVNGETISLPPKTDSFQKWSSSVNKMSVKGEKSNEYLFKDIFLFVNARETGQLFANTGFDHAVISFCLDQRYTREILRSMNDIFETKPHEILLAALTTALNKMTGSKRFLINLEGHGRDILDELDVTRTIGWFTIQYPVMVSCENIEDVGGLLQSVKKNIRFAEEKNKHNTNAIEITPEINFNYLGQFDGDFDSDLFMPSEYDYGDSVSKESDKVFILDISSYIKDDALQVTFSYNKNIFKQEDMQQLSNDFINDVTKIVDYSANPDQIILGKIQPFNDFFYQDCFYSAFFAVAEHFNRDILSFIYTDIFRYEFTEESKSLSCKIKSNIGFEELVSQEGIEVDMKSGLNCVIEEVMSCLKNRKPVILSIDCYEIKMREEYKKNHSSHSILVYGFDENKKVINAIFQSENAGSSYMKHEITFQELKNAYRSYLIHFGHNSYFPAFSSYFVCDEKLYDKRNLDQLR
ncbi:non-ribosomal peptide synthetase, partial [Paenibacillus sp. P3E]|uniref:non-ribosomal peptide synthetase n=1 Tax=Paenibacillus sp. P3E TaxID=1349435 RepID=UPI000AE58378